MLRPSLRTRPRFRQPGVRRAGRRRHDSVALGYCLIWSRHWRESLATGARERPDDLAAELAAGTRTESKTRSRQRRRGTSRISPQPHQRLRWQPGRPDFPAGRALRGWRANERDARSARKAGRYDARSALLKPLKRSSTAETAASRSKRKPRFRSNDSLQRRVHLVGSRGPRTALPKGSVPRLAPGLREPSGGWDLASRGLQPGTGPHR